MDLRANDSLLTELETTCKDTGVNFGEVKTALAGLFGGDKIIGYYINRGANPHALDMVLDIFALSPQCLYDYEIHADYSAWHVVFLDKLIQLSETEVSENKDYFALQVRTSGIGNGLTLHEKITARDEVRAFCLEVKNAGIKRRPEKMAEVE